MSISELFLNLIAPHQCVSCGAEATLLCQACAALLPAVPPRCYRCQRVTLGHRTCSTCRKQSPLVQVWAATPYTGNAKRLIHKLKFERAQAGALAMARAMAAALPDSSQWVVTHVPTAATRVRIRGYDQAQLIAKHVARLRGSLYMPLLVRRGQERQVGHSRLERRQQLAGVFRARQPRLVAGKHILLIDDVLTTGATTEAAATVLLAAGASRVSAAVFAAA